MGMSDGSVASIQPGMRKHTGRRQVVSFAGKNSIEEKAAPTMPIPLDLSSTEDHGYHLQPEADRKYDCYSTLQQPTGQERERQDGGGLARNALSALIVGIGHPRFSFPSPSSASAARWIAPLDLM